MLSMRIVKPSPTRTEWETYPWMGVNGHQWMRVISERDNPSHAQWIKSGRLFAAASAHQGPLSVSPVILVWATACLLSEKLSMISNLGVELQRSLGYFWSSSREGACWDFFFCLSKMKKPWPTRPHFPTPRSIILKGKISELRGILGNYALEFTYPWSLLLSRERFPSNDMLSFFKSI